MYTHTEEDLGCIVGLYILHTSLFLDTMFIKVVIQIDKIQDIILASNFILLFYISWVPSVHSINALFSASAYSVESERQGPPPKELDSLSLYIL